MPSRKQGHTDTLVALIGLVVFCNIELVLSSSITRDDQVFRKWDAYWHYAKLVIQGAVY